MSTKKTCEYLFSLDTGDIIKEALTILQVVNNDDRDYTKTNNPIPFYINYFTKPLFLVIADKRWHVYIIGDKGKYNNRNILNIEGFNTEHLLLSIGAFKNKVYEDAREDNKLFLPDGNQQRIICIKPDYYIDKCIKDDDIYIFNKLETKGTLLTKAKWSIGTDIYSLDTNEYELSAKEIIDVILKDVD